MRVRHAWLVSVLSVLIVLMSIGVFSPSVALAKASHPSRPFSTFNTTWWWRDGFKILVDLWGQYPEPGIGIADETDGNLANCNAYPENGDQNAGYTRNIYGTRLDNSGYTGDITYPADCQYYFTTGLIYQPPQQRPVWGCLDSILDGGAYYELNLCLNFH